MTSTARLSWPPKIGVTWTDDGKADLEVMGSQTRAGRASGSSRRFKDPVPSFVVSRRRRTWGRQRAPATQSSPWGSRLRRAPGVARERVPATVRVEGFGAVASARREGVRVSLFGGLQRRSKRGKTFGAHDRTHAGYFGCKRIAPALSVIALPHNCGQTPSASPHANFR